MRIRCTASCPAGKITTGAAAGYSSYGNQIGLATGQVTELYDPGYVAKRMEIGAVIGASPKANVVRGEPEPGDIIVLLGGSTGRDGMRRRDRFLQGAYGKIHRGLRRRGAEGQPAHRAQNPAPVPRPGGFHASSSAATTSARAACAWPSASWRRALKLI